MFEVKVKETVPQIPELHDAREMLHTQSSHMVGVNHGLGAMLLYV